MGVLKDQDLQMIGPKLKNTCNFHPLEVVGRGSETQLQVGENVYIGNVANKELKYE